MSLHRRKWSQKEKEEILQVEGFLRGMGNISTKEIVYHPAKEFIHLTVNIYFKGTVYPQAR